MTYPITHEGTVALIMYAESNPDVTVVYNGSCDITRDDAEAMAKDFAENTGQTIRWFSIKDGKLAEKGVVK